VLTQVQILGALRQISSF